MARNQRASLYVLLAGHSSSCLSSYRRLSMQAAGRLLVLGALVAAAGPASAQTALPLKHAPARTQAAITPSDLMTRVYLYADDSMMGRLAGSEYNLKATAYIASEVKRMGLQPAGDSGGYFQNVPLVKRQLDPSASLSVEGTAFRPWDEFVPRDSAKVGAPGKTVHGAVSFVEIPAPARNVVAILPGSDPKLKGEYVAIGAHNDHIGFDQTPADHDSLRAFNDALRRLELAAPNHRVTPDQVQQIRVNVDSLRRAHPARRDSIYNGADDDGSGTTSVLEIAEAFAGARGGAKPKRSLIFVWHTGEELGLFGSQYFTDHPTVTRDSIVAQLNMEMVGRGRADDENGGGPGYLQLIGTRRLSTELGDLIETVNKARKQPFTFDYQFDATGHPEQYYCRSDHYMYARYGIPIAFFTTGNHRDYHQVTDEPEYIDYDKLAHVSQFVHDVATAVANLDHRVVVDKPKPDPHGNCVQ